MSEKLDVLEIDNVLEEISKARLDFDERQVRQEVEYRLQDLSSSLEVLDDLGGLTTSIKKKVKRTCKTTLALGKQNEDGQQTYKDLVSHGHEL